MNWDQTANAIADFHKKLSQELGISPAVIQYIRCRHFQGADKNKIIGHIRKTRKVKLELVKILEKKLESNISFLKKNETAMRIEGTKKNMYLRDEVEHALHTLTKSQYKQLTQPLPFKKDERRTFLANLTV